MSKALDHERVSELLSEFTDGTLGASDRAAIESHLEGCPDCRGELRALEALRGHDEIRLTTIERTELEHRVMAGISEETGERPVVPLQPRRSFGARSAQVLGAAAVVAVLATFFYLSTTGGSDDESAVTGRSADVQDESGDLQAEQGGGAGGGGGSGTKSKDRRGTVAAASAADAGSAEDAALGSVPRPAFTVADEPYTAARLQKLGESSLASVTFANYYSADDADGRNTLLEQLVDSAENSAGATVASQVEECASQVLETEDPTIPTFGGTGELDDQAVLVLGFAWSRRSTGPLDRYMVWAWERGSCDAAVEFVEGRIETAG